MALATMVELADQYDGTLFAPAGPVHKEATRLGFRSYLFNSQYNLLCQLVPVVRVQRNIAYFATAVPHSLIMVLLGFLFRIRVAHIHMVHGGTDERLSYGRKKLLRFFRIRFVAVSDFVRMRLVAHDAPRKQIEVIENFLATDYTAQIPQRGAFDKIGVRRAIVISRIDPIKRIDLLLDAMDQQPALAALPIRILGAGSDFDQLKARASANNPNVEFVGVSNSVGRELASTDLLIHLCPDEPFGLAILEAFTAGVPVLVPNTGGAGSLVEHGKTGLKFKANSVEDLARQLQYLMNMPASILNRIAGSAREQLDTRFQPHAQGNRYRNLIQEATK
jgi:glycosyltransferase involved in cell wall biosynthesis